MMVSLMCKAILCINFNIKIAEIGNHQILVFDVGDKIIFIELMFLHEWDGDFLKK